MIGRHPTSEGRYTCALHPDLDADERGAADHLRRLHGRTWTQLQGVEAIPLTTRAERRAARRQAERESARARRHQRRP